MGCGCCIGDCGFCCVVDCCVVDFCSNCSDSSCCVGYISQDNSSQEALKKITEELNNYKKKYEDKAAVTEYTIIEQINESMDSFIKELEGFNNTKYSGRSLNINITAIREKRQELNKRVVGFIGQRMHDRIVTTDSELAVILKEKDDTKRNQNFTEFCNKLINEAKEDLKEEIKETVNAQQDIVKKEINSRLEEINKSMETSKKEYEELVEVADKDIVEQERLQLKYMYQYDIYNVLAEKLGMQDDDMRERVIKKDIPVKVTKLEKRD